MERKKLNSARNTEKDLEKDEDAGSRYMLKIDTSDCIAMYLYRLVEEVTINNSRIVAGHRSIVIKL